MACKDDNTIPLSPHRSDKDEITPENIRVHASPQTQACSDTRGDSRDIITYNITTPPQCSPGVVYLTLKTEYPIYKCKKQ